MLSAFIRNAPDKQRVHLFMPLSFCGLFLMYRKNICSNPEPLYKFRQFFRGEAKTFFHIFFDILLYLLPIVFGTVRLFKTNKLSLKKCTENRVKRKKTIY